MSNNCTPLWRKAHVQVEVQKINCSPRSTFRRLDVAKLQAAVGMFTVAQLQAAVGMFTSSVCRIRLHLGNVAFWCLRQTMCVNVAFIVLVQCCFLLFFCRSTDLGQMMCFRSRQ